MTERDGFEPGVPCWVDTWQVDAEAAVDFYTQLLGWEAEDTMPPGTPGRHFMCRLRGRDVGAIASRPQAAPPVTAWTTYVWVQGVEDSVAKATAAGGSVVVEPFDSLDGGRIAVVADPAGAPLGVWQPGTHNGAQVVNEPGAWSMSMLNTRDLDGSKGFYGALFGWTPEAFGEATLFRLPGYVGGEPQQPVSREVVAVMAPMPPDMPADTPAHWQLDFWVADADATAADAAKLGGQIVAEPFDTPGFRQALVADREGAVFSVSQLVTAGPPSGG
jgi:uncharacterized protein